MWFAIKELWKKKTRDSKNAATNKKVCTCDEVLALSILHEIPLEQMRRGYIASKRAGVSVNYFISRHAPRYCSDLRFDISIEKAKKFKSEYAIVISEFYYADRNGLPIDCC